MIKQIGDRVAIVSSKELGTNCWLARRFVHNGSRCCRVWTCNYPEKKRCQAIHAEIRHFIGEQERIDTVKANIGKRIVELSEMLEK